MSRNDDRATQSKRGDDLTPLQAFHADEGGMISLVTVVAFTFFLILAGMVANAGLTIRKKIETQNAADSVAQSAALVRARGLNAVTAANHLIGELMALVVLHHAVGGDELDNGETPDADPDVKTTLDVSFDIADAVCSGDFPSPDQGTLDAVEEMPEGKATLYDSVTRLQKVFAWDCQAYAIGGVLRQLEPVPIVGEIAYALGMTICVAAKIYEVKIRIEREILKGLEALAKLLRPIKQAIDQTIIPGLYKVESLIVAELPGKVPKVVEGVAQENLVRDAGTAPDRPPLPVHAEPESIDPIFRSQLVRATYPWVNFWRKPVLEFMKDWLVLARTYRYYKKYSNLFTEARCRIQKEERGVNLFVMEGFDPATMAKGDESWTTADGSDEAERLFGVFGAVRRKPPRVISAGIYRQANPDGIFAYAQALTYNANPQERGSADASQAKIGWDTLNWGADVPEFTADPESAPDEPSGYPQVTLNWQAKLVPVTSGSYTKAVPALAGQHSEISQALGRALPFATRDEFRTH